MGPLVIMVVLVCGFWYTENHYQSRIRHARTNGWTSYFYVAMHGCRFVIIGFSITVALLLVLIVFSFITSVLHFFFPAISERDLYSWLIEDDIFSCSSFLIFTMGVGFLWAAFEVEGAKYQLNDENRRLAAYREVAAEDAMESLLVQAIDEEKLVFITLKSRKVYIGYVAAPRIEHSHTQHLVIIPYISGYRDKDTLLFCEQHQYYALYLKDGITADSSPLNLQHFRHVIPVDQVETISLFDTSIYPSFDECTCRKPS